jgi:hypothetical protein
MVALVVQAIIVLIVVGFAYWAWTKVRPIFAQFIAEPFMGLIDVALIILIGAIVVFWFLIPLIKMIPGIVRL